MGYELDRAASVDAYVQYILAQLQRERSATAPYVLSDRSLIDLLAYARYHDNDHVPAFFVEMLEEVVWLERASFDVYCYLPIEFPLVPDEVRTDDEAYRAGVDRMLQDLFAAFDVPVLRVTGGPDERRQQLLDRFGV